MISLSELDNKKFNDFIYTDNIKLLETYTKTKMLLKQETFIEALTRGLITQAIELYKTDVFNKIEIECVKQDIDEQWDGTDFNFLVFIITGISIMLNYTFEEAVLWLSRIFVE